MLGPEFEAVRQLVIKGQDVNTSGALVATLLPAYGLNDQFSNTPLAPVIVSISYVVRGANWAQNVVLTLTEKLLSNGNTVKSTTVTLPAQSVGRGGMVILPNEFQPRVDSYVEITVTTTANAAGAAADLAINYVMSPEVLPLVRQAISDSPV